MLLGCTRHVKSAVVMGRVSSLPLSRRKASLCLTALPHMAISMPRTLFEHRKTLQERPKSMKKLRFGAISTPKRGRKARLPAHEGVIEGVGHHRQAGGGISHGLQTLKHMDIKALVPENLTRGTIEVVKHLMHVIPVVHRIQDAPQHAVVLESKGFLIARMAAEKAIELHVEALSAAEHPHACSRCSSSCPRCIPGHPPPRGGRSISRTSRAWAGCRSCARSP